MPDVPNYLHEPPECPITLGALVEIARASCELQALRAPDVINHTAYERLESFVASGDVTHGSLRHCSRGRGLVAILFSKEIQPVHTQAFI